MIVLIKKSLLEHLISLGLNTDYAEIITVICLLIGVIILGFFIDRIARAILLKGFTSIAKKSKTDWDDILVENKFFYAVKLLLQPKPNYSNSITFLNCRIYCYFKIKVKSA